MSSSRSGQWMPSPRPMRRHFERSAEVPWAKRGYQERGTLTVLPSTKSTTKASSVTETCCASATRSSLAEELIHAPRSWLSFCLTMDSNLLISTLLNPPLSANLTGSSQNLLRFPSRSICTWRGSSRSPESKKNRYGPTRRTVGIREFYGKDRQDLVPPYR